jgi:hypothetical protein
MAIIPEGGMKITRAELELGMTADVVVPATQEPGWRTLEFKSSLAV